jgi:hypothetical protein
LAAAAEAAAATAPNMPKYIQIYRNKGTTTKLFILRKSSMKKL